MKTIKKFRLSFGRYKLQKKVKKIQQNKCIFNLEKSVTVGILFHVSSSKETKTVRLFKNHLERQGKKVFCIGYIDNKIEMEYREPLTGIEYFSYENLNWHYLPNCKETDAFIDLNLDLLIDLSIEPNLPLEYVSNLSKANFKVGRYSENCKHLDLMINISDQTDLNTFIQQITQYLNIINTNAEASF